MVIKHIVISGGGPSGFISYGVLKQLHKQHFWNFEDIESIYGTSIGGILSAILCLKYDWESIDDYFIKRPWDKVLTTDTNDILTILANKGLDGKEFSKIILKPLLNGKGYNIEITMWELYKKTNIELHLFGTNINESNKLNSHDINYKTFPDMKLYEAVAITSAMPMIFKPIIYGDNCYLDGGILHNYPLQQCIENNNMKEILAIKNKWNNECVMVTEKTSVLEYMRILMQKIHNTLDSSDIQPDILYQVECDTEELSNMTTWLDALREKEMRKNLIKKGENIAINFNVN